MGQTRSLFSWCLFPSGGNRLNQQINKSLLDNDKCYDGNKIRAYPFDCGGVGALRGCSCLLWHIRM